MTYSLTPELRVRLKKPLGTLIEGSFEETTRRFKEITEREEPACIIAVGDAVTKSLERSGMIANLSIIDNRIMRKKAEQHLLEADETINVRNPQSTITEEATSAITKALKDSERRTRIVVDGEEDLLALVAILQAPQNALIVYGQPHEGIVVVKATNAKRREISKILKAMKHARKAK